MVEVYLVIAPGVDLYLTSSQHAAGVSLVLL